MNALERQASTHHRQATTLLRETGLLSILRRYGEVQVTGSYALGLMTVRDIDIYVINPKCSDRLAVKLLRALIVSHKFRGYMYSDFTLHRRKGFPRGWYIGLKKRVRGKKWKIDVWLIHKNTRPDMNKLVLTPAQRRTILRLKTRRDREGIRGLDLPSWHIYQAVIKNDKTSKQWLRSVKLVT